MYVTVIPLRASRAPSQKIRPKSKTYNDFPDVRRSIVQYLLLCWARRRRVGESCACVPMTLGSDSRNGDCGFEWDGVVVEGAHDPFDPDDGAEELFVPSAGFMAILKN